MKHCRLHSTVCIVHIQKFNVTFWHSCKCPQSEQESYGIDFGSVGLSCPTSDGIVVQTTTCPLSEEAQVELQRSIDSKLPSVNNGVDIYLNTVAFVMEHMEQ